MKIELDRAEENMIDKGDRSLVAKVCMDCKIGRKVITATRAKVLKVSRPARFQEIGSNVFSITFARQDEGDGRKAMAL